MRLPKRAYVARAEIKHGHEPRRKPDTQPIIVEARCDGANGSRCRVAGSPLMHEPPCPQINEAAPLKEERAKGESERVSDEGKRGEGRGA